MLDGMRELTQVTFWYLRFEHDEADTVRPGDRLLRGRFGQLRVDLMSAAALKPYMGERVRAEAVAL